MTKVKHLIQLAAAAGIDLSPAPVTETRKKTIKSEIKSKEEVTGTDADANWLSIGAYSLIVDDKVCLAKNTRRLGRPAH